MMWLLKIEVLAVSGAVFGGAPLYERAMGQVPGQVDERDITGSLTDRAVNAATSETHAYVAGTFCSTSTTAKFEVRQHDLQNGNLRSSGFSPTSAGPYRSARPCTRRGRSTRLDTNGSQRHVRSEPFR